MIFKIRTEIGRPVRALAFTVASLLAAAAINAGEIFSDNYESGALSLLANANGARWSDNVNVAVVPGKGTNGSSALQFYFKAVPLGSDDFAEQRLVLPQRSEYWFKYRLFVPTNYSHRIDAPSNNKFLAIYASPYETPGYQINISTEPNGAGGSDLYLHYYRNGVEAAPKLLQLGFISDADKGKWMEIVVNAKVPTSSTSSDGVVKVWKNSQQVAYIPNLSSYGGTSNYINQIYLLGWSNSGFTEDTYFYVDDFVAADTPFVVAPNAPASLTVN